MLKFKRPWRRPTASSRRRVPSAAFYAYRGTTMLVPKRVLADVFLQRLSHQQGRFPCNPQPIPDRTRWCIKIVKEEGGVGTGV